MSRNVQKLFRPNGILNQILRKNIGNVSFMNNINSELKYLNDKIRRDKLKNMAPSKMSVRKLKSAERIRKSVAKLANNNNNCNKPNIQSGLVQIHNINTMRSKISSKDLVNKFAVRPKSSKCNRASPQFYGRSSTTSVASPQLNITKSLLKTKRSKCIDTQPLVESTDRKYSSKYTTKISSQPTIIRHDNRRVNNMYKTTNMAYYQELMRTAVLACHLSPKKKFSTQKVGGSKVFYNMRRKSQLFPESFNSTIHQTVNYSYEPSEHPIKKTSNSKKKDVYEASQDIARTSRHAIEKSTHARNAHNETKQALYENEKNYAYESNAYQRDTEKKRRDECCYIANRTLDILRNAKQKSRKDQRQHIHKHSDENYCAKKPAPETNDQHMFASKNMSRSNSCYQQGNDKKSKSTASLLQVEQQYVGLIVRDLMPIDKKLKKIIAWSTDDKHLKPRRHSNSILSSGTVKQIRNYGDCTLNSQKLINLMKATSKRVQYANEDHMNGRVTQNDSSESQEMFNNTYLKVAREPLPGPLYNVHLQRQHTNWGRVKIVKHTDGQTESVVTRGQLKKVPKFRPSNVPIKYCEAHDRY